MDQVSPNTSCIETAAGHNGGGVAYGSDVVTEALQSLGVPYIVLTPGASYRGLHDSLVNHLGNADPQLLLCRTRSTRLRSGMAGPR